MQPTNTLDYLISQGFSPTILERFWKKVNKTETCWLWTAAVRDRLDASNMYGVIYVGGSYHPRKCLPSHRVSWIIHFGAIPEGIDVLHTCDCPPCVRPDHLFLGTAFDNTQDMISKGRRGKGNAKLTDAQARSIFLLRHRLLNREIAEVYGVSKAAISHIMTGRNFNSVTKARSNS